LKIGIDIVEVSRISKFLERFGDKGLDRFLDKDERLHCKKIESIAGFWAAKEAVAKALGCGIGAEFGFLDVKIDKDKRGAPKLVFSTKAIERFGIKETSLSITHDGGFAIAAVLLLTV